MCTSAARKALAVRTTVPMFMSCCQFSMATWKPWRRVSSSATIASTRQYRYRYWRVEAIVAELDTRRHGFHVAIENWQHDMNIGTVVRTANAFLAAEVHIVGRRRWNKRGAMVTDRYQHVRHHADLAELASYAKSHELPLLGIDNLPGSVPLETYDLPRGCV